MKNWIKGTVSLLWMASCALMAGAQDATVEVPAGEIPSSLASATSLKLTGTWDTPAFQELKAALGTNAFLGSNTALERVDMSEAVVAEGTSWYVSAGLSKNGVFMNCKNLVEVVMPSAEEAAHIVSLQNAFQNCSALETVDLSGLTGVTTFNNAFYGCAALSSPVDLSGNTGAVTSGAWSSAFEGCSSLPSVKLPAGFVPASKVFSGCTSLQEIDWTACTATEVPAYNSDMLGGVELSGVSLTLAHAQYELFKADDGWSQLNLVDADPAPSTEYKVDASDIPNSLKEATALTLTGTWDSDAFNNLCMALMDNPAFGTNSNETLRKIDMSGIQVAEGTSLWRKGLSEYGIFRNFKALEEVAMPAPEEAAHFTNFCMAFQNCPALREIDLSGCAGLVSLEQAFKGCVSLAKADLGASVSLEGTDQAFESCEALASVVLPANFPLGKRTFAYCNALAAIDWTAFEGTEAPPLPGNTFMGVDDLVAITLSLKYEAYRLFSADEDWSELTLYNTEPDKVTDYVVDASDIPLNLKRAVTLTLTGEWDSDKLNLLSIALGNNGGLFATTNTTLVKLDMSQITVAEGTELWRSGIKEYGIFNNCTALEEVLLPAAEESAKFTKLSKAFSGCTALKDVDLSLLTGATDIEEAFVGTAIEKADLGGCTALGSTVRAFEGCAALKEVVLPACFVPANYTFADCVSLGSVDFTAYEDAEAPACANNTFMGIDDLGLVTLKVSESSHEAFEAHKIWSQFKIEYKGTGVQGVKAAEAQEADVYTVDGRYVGTYKNDGSLMQRLPHAGIYIVGGKKVVKTK